MKKLLKLLPSKIIYEGNYYALYMTKYNNTYGAFYSRLTDQENEIFAQESKKLKGALRLMYKLLIVEGFIK